MHLNSFRPGFRPGPSCQLGELTSLPLPDVEIETPGDDRGEGFTDLTPLPTVPSRDSNPESRDPGPVSQSRKRDWRRFNPGIPYFGIIKKLTKCPNFTRYLPEKYFFPNFGGNSRLYKLRVSGHDPNTNYVIMENIVLRAQSC